jgi:hypothetical protein
MPAGRSFLLSNAKNPQLAKQNEVIIANYVNSDFKPGSSGLTFTNQKTLAEEKAFQKAFCEI